MMDLNNNITLRMKKRINTQLKNGEITKKERDTKLRELKDLTDLYN